jgi:D-arabinose 1-dehydrogenase-like Zn-dependent alcohol dehydrogenase
MLGVVFLGDRKLALRDFPDPTPGPRDVVLEIKASGMCGSDLHVYRASFKPGDTTSGFARGSEPVIAGHEPCGVVVAVGSGVSEKEARIGARVMDHHYTGCGTCKHCRSGWAQMCLDGATVFGANGNGAHAKYMKVPVATLVPLPDSLSFETALPSPAAPARPIRCSSGSTCRAARRSRSSGRGRSVSRRRSSPSRWVRA